MPLPPDPNDLTTVTGVARQARPGSFEFLQDGKIFRQWDSEGTGAHDRFTTPQEYEEYQKLKARVAAKDAAELVAANAPAEEVEAEEPEDDDVEGTGEDPDRDEDAGSVRED